MDKNSEKLLEHLNDAELLDFWPHDEVKVEVEHL